MELSKSFVFEPLPPTGESQMDEEGEFGVAAKAKAPHPLGRWPRCAGSGSRS